MRVRPSILDRDSGQGPVRLLLFNLLTYSKENNVKSCKKSESKDLSMSQIARHSMQVFFKEQKHYKVFETYK